MKYLYATVFLMASVLSADFSPSYSQPSEQVAFAPVSSSKLALFGVSNLSQFVFKTDDIQGEGVFCLIRKESSASAIDSVVGYTVEISLPIQSLKSGNPLMDADMHETLKAEEYAYIHYALSSFEIEKQKAGKYGLRTFGMLTLAGVKNDVEMVVDIESLDGNRFRVRGQKTLRMTEFGIRPPAALGGLVKTKDQILIRFDVQAAPKKAILANTEQRNLITDKDCNGNDTKKRGE